MYTQIYHCATSPSHLLFFILHSTITNISIYPSEFCYQGVRGHFAFVRASKNDRSNAQLSQAHTDVLHFWPVVCPSEVAVKCPRMVWYKEMLEDSTSGKC